MTTTETINWKRFKEKLLNHNELTLQFKYAEDKFVDSAYHITEIKQAPITSVDCGGVVNKWTEIVVQLWVPEDAEPTEAMKVSKALSIIDLVEKLLPLDPFATVKVEFGSSDFDTRQMLPNNLTADSETLIIDLSPDTVQCKAQTRGGSCGTGKNDEECCTPTSMAKKPKIKLANLTAGSTNSCTPGSGCC